MSIKGVILKFKAQPKLREEVTEEIHKLFLSNASKSYKVILDLIEAIEENKKSIFRSFSDHALKEFASWIRCHGNETFELNRSLQCRALLLSSELSSDFACRLAFEAFKMKGHPEIFLSNFERLNGLGRYVQITKWLLYFNIEEFSEPPDYLIALIVTQEYDLLKEYLQTFPKELDCLLHYFDQILMLDKIGSILRKFFSKKQVKFLYNNLHFFVSEFLSKMNVNVTRLPALQLLKPRIMIKDSIEKVKSGKMDKSMFFHLMKETCLGKKDLISDLLQEMEKQSLNSCLYEMCQVLGVPDKYENLKPNCEHLLTVDAIPRLILDRSQVAIEFLDSDEQSHKLKDFLSTNKESKVGIDIEKKPEFTKLEINPPALLQIAFTKCVFLVDLLKIKETPKLLQVLSQCVFQNKKLTKLCYGGASDRGMVKGYPYLKFVDFNDSFLDLLDVQNMLSYFVSRGDVSFPYRSDLINKYNLRGLQHLVYMCSGKYLSKGRIQMSNWEERPLKDNQKEYAALDAHSLLKASDVLIHMCKKANIDLRMCFFSRVKRKLGKENTINSRSSIPKAEVTAFNYVPECELPSKLNPPPISRSPCVYCFKPTCSKKFCKNRTTLKRLFCQHFSNFTHILYGLNDFSVNIVSLVTGLNFQDFFPIHVVCSLEPNALRYSRRYFSRVFILKSCFSKLIKDAGDLYVRLKFFLDSLDNFRRFLKDIISSTKKCNRMLLNVPKCGYCFATNHNRTSCRLLLTVEQINDALKCAKKDFNNGFLSIIELKRLLGEFMNDLKVSFGDSQKVKKGIYICGYCYKWGHIDLECVLFSVHLNSFQSQLIAIKERLSSIPTFKTKK